MLVVTDRRIPDAAQKTLIDRGATLIKLPPHPALPAPVASHPDLLLFFAPDAICCTESYQKVAAPELELICAAIKKPIRTVSEELGATYPKDILLNAAPVGSILFCHPTHTARTVREHPAYHTLPVRQGYTKCSTLPVGDQALITEDPSITAAATARGIEVLQISKGAVTLKGYDTGFLGGASSFSPYGAYREILFCGALECHPDAKRIRDFCNQHGYGVTSLSDEPLCDVGTMFVFDLIT